ncbi:hypothetical protein A1O1_06563 [Capronia coronata CBS 617.96]|uniref:BPL/LPL catalytic domain-containing protein n=1 Tax=Capronia coronata CBS 617.96 TaxID=1182541 RepID=W9Y128_9EURO|nr:uncharacterized protein A1O1_06563 [Capronia coronata CBS 617.96]EXJ86193.1 hypothetical protein A1O1_06563 [Capronia coronata CBS 617.96]
MRLAHLHIPHLIPYTHSLRLQNALVERQFAYKDLLRSLAGGRERDQSTEPEKIRDKIVHHAPEPYNDGGTGLRPSPSSSTQSPNSDKGAATKSPADVAQNDNQAPNTGYGNSSHASDFTSVDLSPPDPTLLTFSTFPTYTVGRRHLLANPISSEQQAFLTADGRATFHASPRGGLLTYHAPGQLTGYIVADLRRHGITPRCWVKLLEESVIRTCAVWGVATMRTDDPGVWMDNRQQQPSSRSRQDSLTAAESDSSPQSDRKICALGVQVSRGITSHGIGFNVFDAAIPSSPSHRSYDFTPAQVASASYFASTKGYLSWGFSRIVACGLEGKSVTWLTRERGRNDTMQLNSEDGSGHELELNSSESQSHGQTQDRTLQALPDEHIALESVADVFAQEICRGLNSMRAAGKETVDGAYRIQEEDILSWERKS